MWCDNCLLVFPLRAGAMILATIMAMYQIGWGVFLFVYGGFYFTILHEAEIYGGYSMAQGALAVVGIVALGSRSYALSRVIVYVYPVIIVLGAVRAGIMMWSFNHYSWRLVWSCDNGGVKWTDMYQNDYYNLSPDKSKFTKLPPMLCRDGLERYGVEGLSATFAAFLVADFVIMCYYYFLSWRFGVRLQHYPVQKSELVYPN